MDGWMELTLAMMTGSMNTAVSGHVSYFKGFFYCVVQEGIIITIWNSWS